MSTLPLLIFTFVHGGDSNGVGGAIEIVDIDARMALIAVTTSKPGSCVVRHIILIGFDLSSKDDPPLGSFENTVVFNEMLLNPINFPLLPSLTLLQVLYYERRPSSN